MDFNLFIYFFILGLIHNGNSQVAIFEISFENPIVAHQGLGWPAEIHVARGNECLMKLLKPLDNFDTCTVIAPSGLQFNIESPPSNRYQKWGDDCGLRVRNVTFEDIGRWRLTSARGSSSVSGWIAMHVLEPASSYIAPPISLQDGQTQATVDLSSMDNAYCVVAKPFSESSLVPGRCSVTLDRTTRAVQGEWQIFLGVPGSVAELRTDRHVTVQTERLDVGFIHDSENKLHLYCNILNTNKNITFCRFQRTSYSYGYNVIDGLSDGTHSYYGEGFVRKQCGMTIESPSSQDYGTWRCSVGVQMFVGTVIQQQPTMQALISVTQNRGRQLRDVRTEELRTIFVQEDSEFTISCNAQASLSYCWFQHPNGSHFTPVQQSDEEQLFWYSGESLEVGDCGITFKNGSTEDSGKWTCHMGRRDTLGLEMTDEVYVRVTGALAAHEKEVSVTIGAKATLYCHTASGRRTLNYCRFLSPNFVGMSVDPTVTEDDPILDRYYFTPERDINVGDCSLNIISVREEDLGVWTCAAEVDGEVLESSDTMRVYIDETQVPQFRAGIIGMSVGLSALVVVLVGYLTYKKGWIAYFKRSSSNTVVSDQYSLQTRNTSGSRSSGSSFESQIQRSQSFT